MLSKFPEGYEEVVSVRAFVSPVRQAFGIAIFQESGRIYRSYVHFNPRSCVHFDATKDQMTSLLKKISNFQHAMMQLQTGLVISLLPDNAPESL